MTHPNGIGTSGGQATEEDVGGPDNRWWNGFASLEKPRSSSGSGRNYHRGRVPYQFKSMGEEGFIGRGYCVKAFPFVGPRRPPQTLGYADWDRWEDSFAYCAGNRVIVGRCSDTSKTTWTAIHTWHLLQVDPNEEEEALYSLDWTIDPFTLQPLIVVGGLTGNVHILDCGTGKLRRTLTGHGESISAVASHPKHLHIIATGSSDASIRIWNIFGADPLPETDQTRGRRSENYGQARADEGTAVVAVLAGQLSGGHDDEVTDLDWHPQHHALASCSMDHSVKIWPVPPLPPASLAESRSFAPWTAENRPLIVHSPMFSTARTTLSPNSGVRWIAVDTLLVFGLRKSVMIQWTGYLRYFDRRQEKWLMPRIDNIQSTDWENSGSFRILRKFRTKGTIAGLKMGYHARFTPTPREEEDINTVTDHLFVVPRVHPNERQAQQRCTMSLYAVGLTPPNKPPRFDTRLRSGASAAVPQSLKWLTIERYKGQDNIVISDDEDTDEEVQRAAGQGENGAEDRGQDESLARTAEPPNSPIDRKPTVHECEYYADNDAWLSDATDTDDEYDGPPYRWELEVEAGRKMRKHGKKLVPDISMSMTEVESWLQACAISPRGAKWIVGVGDFESIFVWRRKDVDVDVRQDVDMDMD